MVIFDIKISAEKKVFIANKILHHKANLKVNIWGNNYFYKILNFLKSLYYSSSKIYRNFKIIKL